MAIRVVASEIHERAQKAWEMAESCHLCPNGCRVNRNAGEIGRCGLSNETIVSSSFVHHGEESPIRGYGGSGTLFFSGCNLLCLFCQNEMISHRLEGRAESPSQTAERMLWLQKQGCVNINLVTPSHVVPHILEAIAIAVERDLSLPIVYNSGGYDSVEALELLDGIVDIYMPDFKFWSAEVAEKLTGCQNYPDIARAAIREMHRQVGDLVLDTFGVAQRGLLVRHLVLPNGLAGTREIMKYLHDDISPQTYVTIQGQYHPCYKALDIPEISRSVLYGEVLAAKHAAMKAGITRFAD